MEISQIIETYKSHDTYFREKVESLKLSRTEIEYPIAHEILFDLSKRIDNIYHALISLTTSDNLYPAYILYRSLLEHFFKAFFIFAKTAKDKNDETAEKYQKHYFISEYLAEQAGVLEMEDLINGNTEKTDFISFLTTKMPSLKDFDKQDQKEISLAIKDFNVKAIAKYFYAEFLKDKTFMGEEIFAKTIPEYSYASTFIHGGAYASNLMKKFYEQNLINQELDKLIRIGFTCCCIAKENVIMLYKFDSSIIDIIKQLHKIRST